MKSGYKVTRVQFMTMDEGEGGRMMPSLWDTDPGENGSTTAIKVAVEMMCDADGNPMSVLISSDDSHVMFAEESLGEQSLEDAE